MRGFSDALNERSISARVQTTVGQQVLTRHVTSLTAAEEGADRTEFFSRAKALGRNLRSLSLTHRVQRLARLGGRRLMGGHQTVGIKLAGQDIVDGHALGGNARASQARYEALPATPTAMRNCTA